jgi:prepilin-type N-terminal cleavage/methylation domain-containing protein
MRASERRRGLTLIELMVSLAVVSIILAAVMSVVVTITRQRRQSSNVVDTRVNGRVALSLMSFDASNAGYRFGTPPLAVRVLQNITGAEAELADVAAFGGCAGLAGWVPVPGTDVIEFREGAQGRVPGRVVGSTVGCGTTCTLQLNDGNGNPFNSPTEGTNSILFFSNGTTGCAARLTSDIQGGQVTMLKADLRTPASATNYAQTGNGACPRGDMTVTALGQTTRFMVCRPPPLAAPTERPGLFRQRYNGRMEQTAFERVQEGIEDLQVASLLANQVNGVPMVAGPTCTGGGAAARCTCDITIGGDCGNYEPDPTAGAGALNGASAAVAERSAMLLRAVRVAVTTVSTRARGYGAEFAALTRPASYDHAAGVPGTLADQAVVGADNNQRAIVEATFLPQNIVMVVP